MARKIEQMLRLAADMKVFENMGKARGLEEDELSEDALMLVAAAADPLHGEKMFKEGFQVEIGQKNKHCRTSDAN